MRRRKREERRPSRFEGHLVCEERVNSGRDGRNRCQQEGCCRKSDVREEGVAESGHRFVALCARRVVGFITVMGELGTWRVRALETY